MNAEDTFYFAKLSQLGVEEWLPVPGYEGYYEVSNFGQVRSLDRVIPHKGYGTKKIKGGPMSLGLNSRGYLQIRLAKGYTRYTTTVHALVASVFIGLRPEGLDVCHNDGNQVNNYLYNLRYDTKKNNSADRDKHGKTVRGSKAAGSKLTEDNVIEIRKLLESESVAQVKIAKRFGVSPRTISGIKCGNSWAHVT